MPEEKQKNTEIFETMPVAKAVNTMAVPTVISQLIVLIYNIADTFFIGRTGNSAMVGGASLILPVFNISLSISGLAGIGGGALVSRLLGSRRQDEARRVYSLSVYISVLVSALFALGVLIFNDPLMRALGADESNFRYASSYAFFVITLGGVPTVLSNTLAALLRSVGESKKAGFGITMGGLVNIALDPLFMFVLMPEGKEIVGAGAATCLSNCLACAYFIATIARMRDEPVLRLCKIRDLPERENIAGIFTVGLPSAIATLLFDLDYVVIDRLMSGWSGDALSAIGIVLKAERLPLNVGIGICQGMMPIIAYNYSAKNFGRMRSVKRYSMLLGLGCAAVSIAFYELFAGQIMSFFIVDSPNVVELGTGFLRARVLATPLMFLSFFHVYLFNGFGQGKYALFLGVTRWLVFNIPMLFILDHLLGVQGIVWSQAAADTLTVTLSVTLYKWYERRNMSA